MVAGVVPGTVGPGSTAGKEAVFGPPATRKLAPVPVWSVSQSPAPSIAAIVGPPVFKRWTTVPTESPAATTSIPEKIARKVSDSAWPKLVDISPSAMPVDCPSTILRPFRLSSKLLSLIDMAAPVTVLLPAAVS